MLVRGSLAEIAVENLSQCYRSLCSGWVSAATLRSPHVLSIQNCHNHLGCAQMPMCLLGYKAHLWLRSQCIGESCERERGKQDLRVMCCLQCKLQKWSCSLPDMGEAGGRLTVLTLNDYTSFQSIRVLDIMTILTFSDICLFYFVDMTLHACVWFL